VTVDQKAPESKADRSDDTSDMQSQMERASLFTHTALSDAFARLGQTQVVVQALVSLLVEAGVVTEEKLDAGLVDSRQKLSEQGVLAGPGVAMRVDDDSIAATTVPVDCAARIHVCHAACCKLNFALSVKEVEAGHAKWDLGRPYFVRQGEDHYCSHMDRQTHGCGIYNNRPGVCRKYSCANDARIWKDFDRMILNEEWIEANLSAAANPSLHGTFMISPKQTAANTLERAD
jgi:Fe-S-cluster containining protein